MKRLFATLLTSTVALLAVAAGSASAACVAPYCPAPTATAPVVQNVTDTSAELSGTVAANGADSVSWQIQLGTASGSYTTVVGSGSLSPGGRVSATATGLAPNTTYYFRIAATTVGGNAWSQQSSFTTDGTPSTNPPDNGNGGNNDAPSGNGDNGNGGNNDAPSGNPGAPTPQQVAEAHSSSRDELGSSAKPDKGFGVEDVLVFKPGAGGGKDRPANTPVVRQDSAKFDRSSLGEGDTQNLLALSCPLADCTATFEITIVYRAANGKKKTIKLSPSVDIAAGETGLLELDLPKAVRKAILAGRKVSMDVGFTLASAAGDETSETQSLDLEAKKAKKAKKGKKK